ncbi:nucleophile aminohydrolase [Scheffersomyces xylosifermentans]|uniref:nucleophile aminohydrolase n=1 Tax=Scheffersomyces xylosifermentans TaxID=1304137 RepID=UPI00315E018F
MVHDKITIIHIGAGNHSLSLKDNYKQLMKRALRQSDFLAVAKTIECSKLTNTGYGSSLNLAGEVECDSSFIEYTTNSYNQIRSRSLIGIDRKYPIVETWKLFENLDKIYRGNRMGLSRPTSLHFRSAINSVHELDPSAEVEKDEMKNDTLKSTEAKRIYETYKDKLFNGEVSLQAIPELSQEITDTVGLIEVSTCGTKIATSSGGNFFKIPGRIGCAGVIGAAIDFQRSEFYEISCMCSGNGEDIISMQLASYVCSRIIRKAEQEQGDIDFAKYLEELVQQRRSLFELSSTNQEEEASIYVGVIVTINDLQQNRITLAYCHSTECLYWGFKVSQAQPNIVLSRLASTAKIGHSFSYGEFRL